jgi:hypothetical protein
MRRSCGRGFAPGLLRQTATGDCHDGFKEDPADIPGHSGQDLAQGAVELSEAQLADASGGAVFPSGPNQAGIKWDSAHKIDTDPACCCRR